MRALSFSYPNGVDPALTAVEQDIRKVVFINLPPIITAIFAIVRESVSLILAGLPLQYG
jgi:hypothetical protein